MMRRVQFIVAALLLVLLAIGGASFFMAWSCGLVAWWPLHIHRWINACGQARPDALSIAGGGVVLSALGAGIIGNLGAGKRKTAKFGAEKWATLSDVNAAKLIMGPDESSQKIRVVGKFEGNILTYTGDSHVVAFMGNRSGKGRGIGVPTALSFAQSVVFHDPKGELFRGDPRHGFPGTAGFRAAAGHRIVYFNPTDSRSAHYNPLLGVRKGRTEIRDMQSLIIILMGRAPKDFWEKGGGRLVLAIGLHILYAEPNREKCLAGMGRFLDLGDAGLERIIEADSHPTAVQIAKSFFPSGQGSKDAEKVKGMRSGLYWTARNFLNPFDDETVQDVTSGLSHFEPADLVRHDAPTDLYLVMPAGDQEQDSVIISLIISQILRELMGPELDKTVSGHTKRHEVLLFLDEVAALGSMGDFGKKLPQMPGYGITALLIYQSIKQVAVTFGPASGITENFDVFVAGASTDEDTARWLSALIGNATERDKVVSRSRPAGALFGGVETVSERETYRPVMDTGAVFEIPEDEQLVFRKSHKPIWAKKLRYDEEDIFKSRLLPPPPIGDGTGTYPGLEMIQSPWWTPQHSQIEAGEEAGEDSIDIEDEAFWKVD